MLKIDGVSEGKNMSKENIYYTGVSINFKKIVYLLLKYKVSNIFLFILFLLGGVAYIYFTVPEYRTYMTIEVERPNPNPQHDFLRGIRQNNEGIETEIDVLRSRFLVEKALKSVKLDIQYFAKENLKTVEIYGESPFLVQDVKIKDEFFYGKMFKIKILDENSFYLSMEKDLGTKISQMFGKEERKREFEKFYLFDQKIDNPSFSFKIHKLKNIPKNRSFYFKINPFSSLINSALNNLSVSPFSFQSSVLKAEYQDTNPKRAKDFLNALGEEYLKQSIERKTKETSNSLYFIEDQLKIVNKRLQESQQKLKKFQAQNRLINIGVQSEDMIHRVSTYEARLAEAKVERDSLKILIRELRKGNYEAVSGFSAQYPVLANFVTNYQNAIIQRDRLLNDYTKMHPLVIANKKQIENIKESIKNTIEGIKKSIDIRIKELETSISSIEKTLISLPSKEKEYANLERKFRVNERLYNYLLERESEMKVAKAATVSQKRILDHAMENEIPVKPKKSLIMAVSVLLGIVSVIIITLLRYTLDTKIKTKRDIEEISQIPIFGEIPFITNKKLYKTAYVLDNPRSPASEALRTIRTNIEFTPSEHKSKIIVLTSTVPNEGKTVVTANLATVLGMGEKKCIVVSCDLRRPELHVKFSIPNRAGISNVLAGKVKLEDVIWEHEELTNFDIITSGFIPPNPYELLDSKKMREIIEKLRKTYDYIVIDTPPIDLVSDALLLMRYADITLFVCKSEFSDRRFVEKISALVEKYHIKNAGFILNAVKEKYREKMPYDERYLMYSRY